jgi:hypothetical protein
LTQDYVKITFTRVMSFEFSTDRGGELGVAITPELAGGNVIVEDEVVRVVLGSPALFTASIPRSLITDVQRAPDLKACTDVPGSGSSTGRAPDWSNSCFPGLFRRP